MEKRGIIYDIKEFTVHDGPGARVTVFLKGCPLRCVWCHNPEGLLTEKQLMYKENLCTHCKKCEEVCKHEECLPFSKCIKACHSGALSVSGEEFSADELSKRILKNSDFFKMTGGGVTISGGEPMMQSEFVICLAEKLGDIHKAIQTSGFADSDTYKKVINRFDFVMQDIKLADSSLHRKYTGTDNSIILKNIKYLKQCGKEFVFRVPLIPDITDTEENLRQISKIAGESRVELLRYNSLAGAKYKMLGWKYPLEDKVNRKVDFTHFFENAILI